MSRDPICRRKAALCAAGAVLCFHAAYLTPLGFLICGYVACLVQLARLRSGRLAFYGGLFTGLLCYAPQLTFFYGLFGAAAFVLWAILAFWTGLFVALAHGIFRRVHGWKAATLTAAVWMGLEYFRGELYFLRFTWLNVGYALAGSWTVPILRTLGMYGIGFLVAWLAAHWLTGARKIPLIIGSLALVFCFASAPFFQTSADRPLRIAGIQMEFPSTPRLLAGLDRLAGAHPDAEVLMTSEYTCDGEVPGAVKNWCREHARYLVIGGKAAAPGGTYYDTAFVIGPAGEIVFQQGKCVPIQFFDDGLPATEQRVWDSPWGKLGFCICYDLSYRRVTDPLVRLGAQALIVPTMDVESWGRHEHELHRRVAWVRAAEYGVPVFRVASSGISQVVDAEGREVASAPFPGEDAMLSATLLLGPAGRRPLDYWLAPLAVAITAGNAMWLLVAAIRRKSLRSPAESDPAR